MTLVLICPPHLIMGFRSGNCGSWKFPAAAPVRTGRTTRIDAEERCSPPVLLPENPVVTFASCRCISGLDRRGLAGSGGRAHAVGPVRNGTGPSSENRPRSRCRTKGDSSSARSTGRCRRATVLTLPADEYRGPHRTACRAPARGPSAPAHAHPLPEAPRSDRGTRFRKPPDYFVTSVTTNSALGRPDSRKPGTGQMRLVHFERDMSCTGHGGIRPARRFRPVLGHSGPSDGPTEAHALSEPGPARLRKLFKRPPALRAEVVTPPIAPSWRRF